MCPLAKMKGMCHGLHFVRRQPSLCVAHVLCSAVKISPTTEAGGRTPNFMMASCSNIFSDTQFKDVIAMPYFTRIASDWRGLNILHKESHSRQLIRLNGNQMECSIPRNRDHSVLRFRRAANEEGNITLVVLVEDAVAHNDSLPAAHGKINDSIDRSLGSPALNV